jgi:zinc protease
MDAITVSVRSLARTFAPALDLLADVTLRPSFPAEEIERQRVSRLAQLVQERDDPAQVVGRVTAAALYGPRHPYGYGETGTETAVRSLTHDELASFWKQHFVPIDAALVPATSRWPS